MLKDSKELLYFLLFCSFTMNISYIFSSDQEITRYKVKIVSETCDWESFSLSGTVVCKDGLRGKVDWRKPGKKGNLR